MSVRRVERRDPKGAVREYWYVDVVFEHADGRRQRIRKVSPVQTRRAAEQYEREVRQALLDDTYGKEQAPAKVVPTLSEFQRQFLEHSEVNDKASGHRAKKEIFVNHLVPMFGTTRLNEITTAKIEGLKLAKLKAGLTKKTVNNLLAVLSKTLSLARDWELIDSVPKVEWFRVPKAAFDFLTFEEAETLVRCAEPGRWQTMIILAINTGLRISELAGLSWSDINLPGRKLLVRQRVYKGDLDSPKSGKAREMPLNKTASDALASLPRRVGSNWVFPQKDGGYLRNPQHSCADAIRRQARLAGLRSIGWHTLRHTFASHLVMKGVPIKAVQELMGHGSLAMTERYAHLSPTVRIEAVGLLDAPPGPAYGNLTATGTDGVARNDESP